jgi:probable rRNA maturation factor
MPRYTIEITERRIPRIADHKLLDQVVRRVLTEEQIEVATISLALVSDAEIHEVNRQFLGHDYPTDVISFRLNEPAEASRIVQICSAGEICVDLIDGADRHPNETIDGELIVSTETAIREAGAHGWSPKAELVLYVVHGLLHLCGYDDATPEARPVMRSRERELLAIWGFCPTGLEP